MACFLLVDYDYSKVQKVAREQNENARFQKKNEPTCLGINKDTKRVKQEKGTHVNPKISAYVLCTLQWSLTVQQFEI